MELISREQAIDAVRMVIGDNRSISVCDAIKQLPPIQPKRGRWIPVTNGRSGHECDQCHNYAPSYQTGEEHLSDFCPSCGADMRTAEQIVHDAIDNTPMAEDAYPGIKERLHKAVDDMREVTT